MGRDKHGDQKESEAQKERIWRQQWMAVHGWLTNPQEGEGDTGKGRPRTQTRGSRKDTEEGQREEESMEKTEMERTMEGDEPDEREKADGREKWTKAQKERMWG